ncbi:LURP-one-related/scramblase family protein [Candidatus Stoquefichus massiliensis]|uniref:LURP-one-related/scramblase family protein n=1 Tax=Candidatus Stoquefichus massiliensis TaxID=1470350 RepID=UPI000481178C|nr:LURP-one-related family protein [Candidatus Stoquefichus massiliensis]
MKLLFKQRLFSWFDSYDIYDENNQTLFTVKGQLSWGHCLQIYNQNNEHIGTIKEEIFTFLPKFNMYLGNEYIGRIYKEFSLFKPAFHLDCLDWQVRGNWLEWDYQIINSKGIVIAIISKEIFHLTDTYVIDIIESQNTLYVLMIVLAIDAEKCSRNN